jgi:hypothetical protein
VPSDLPEGTLTKKLASPGMFYLNKVQYKIGADHGFKRVLIITDGPGGARLGRRGDQITVADLHGEILAELTRPRPGVTYVGNGRPAATGARTPNVSEVLRHQPSPMS